ncbi:hypothetical protein ACFO4P_10110 [Epilithonimonas pallida]|uniref:Uncharacterized protein n=1 Tax=Epilithonimonas pallida TaxID=373671 RepID=A0ABY1R2L5_9FLAO|nr:hypothetical protein [Epilithonimonas pallida]SMP92831.1 hypothetical protein SAMN05421679_104206 [Epilithonimonas pallida]
MENIEVLRSKLVERIFSTTNVNFLQAVENLFLSVQPEEDAKYILSKSQKEMILVAEEILNMGELFPTRS